MTETLESLQAYAGRWVALVQGRVAGVGLTAEAALAAAQLARPKEKARVQFVPRRVELHFPDLLNDVRQALPPEAAVWLVGGAVRDALLGRPVHDLDFVVDGRALPLARVVANALHAAFYALDDERDVGRVVIKCEGAETFVLDFARLRGGSLAADLALRDFTVNAVAAPLAEPQALIDPLNGAADLHAKRLRLCAPSAIADDPLRGVRAIRLAAKFNFHLEPETRAAIRAAAPALAQISSERKRDEFIRCLGGPRPAAAMRALDQLGLLEQLVPELLKLKGLAQPADKHALDGWEHTLATVAKLDELLRILGPVHDQEAASDLILGLAAVRLGRFRQALAQHLDQMLEGDHPARWLLMLAALLHDVGKSQTGRVAEDGQIHFYEHERLGAEQAAEIMARLRFSNVELKRVQTIIAHHLRPAQLARDSGPTLTPRVVYRFFRDTGEAGIEIALLMLADYLAHFAGNPPPPDEWNARLSVSAQLLEAYFEKRAERVLPPPLLTGHDLMKELELKPGPPLGVLLEAIREAQAAGEVTDRESALTLARQKLAAGI